MIHADQVYGLASVTYEMLECVLRCLSRTDLTDLRRCEVKKQQFVGLKLIASKTNLKSPVRSPENVNCGGKT